MRGKIPTNLHDAVIDESGKGLSSAEIRDWLLKTHNIKTSTPAVCRLLNKLKIERKEIAQRVYADAVSKSANNDIFIIGDVIKKCKKRFDILIDNEEDFKAKTMAEVMFKYISKRMDLAGLNEKTDDDNSIKEELLKKIGNL